MWIDRALLGAFLAGVATFYVFILSAGHFAPWPPQTAYHDGQAEGFRAGHLYVASAPNPRLLEVENPLDRANARWWSWDYSFYEKRLHIYWGLAPAALLAVVKTVIRRERAVGDDVLVFVFLMGRAFVGCLWILALARMRLPRPPTWSVWLAMLVFAAANPMPFMLARGAVYEAAIAGGAFFSSAGLYCSFRWLFSEHAPVARRWLAAASSMLGLAGACRPSLLPMSAAIVVVLVVAAFRGIGGGATHIGSLRRSMRLLSLAALPYTAVTVAQLLANHLRFGSWKEFGVRYQMSLPFSMGAEHAPTNLWTYLVYPVHTLCQFPFLITKWHTERRAHLPDWLPTPAAHYAHEPVTGLLNTVPFLWLLAGLSLAHLLERRGRFPSDSISRADASRWRSYWCVLAVATLVGSGPVLGMFAFSMRYVADFLSSMLIMATLGGWALLRVPTTRPGRLAASTLYTTLALASISFGVLLGFTGPYQHFERHNRALWDALQQALSLCTSR